MIRATSSALCRQKSHSLHSRNGCGRALVGAFTVRTRRHCAPQQKHALHVSVSSLVGSLAGAGRGRGRVPTGPLQLAALGGLRGGKGMTVRESVLGARRSLWGSGRGKIGDTGGGESSAGGFENVDNPNVGDDFSASGVGGAENEWTAPPSGGETSWSPDGPSSSDEIRWAPDGVSTPSSEAGTPLPEKPTSRFGSDAADSTRPGSPEDGPTSFSSSTATPDVSSSSSGFGAPGPVDGAAPAASDGWFTVDPTALGSIDPSELGLWPHHILMRLMEDLHVAAGMPYWQTILAMSLALRLITLPFFVSSAVQGARMNMASLDLAPITAKTEEIQNRYVKEFKAAEEAGCGHDEAGAVYHKEMEDVKKEYQATLKVHNVQPWKIFAGILQAPFFMSMFFATRQMGLYFPDYATGGLAFAQDLTAGDPTFVLPVVSWLAVQTFVEIQPMTSPTAPKLPIDIKQMMRMFGLMTLPVALGMPAGTVLYMSMSTVCLIVQRVCFIDRLAVKKLLGIPTPEDIARHRMQAGAREYERAARAAAQEEARRRAAAAASDHANRSSEPDDKADKREQQEGKWEPLAKKDSPQGERDLLREKLPELERFRNLAKGKDDENKR